MFGWEFPPHILGGLGTASYGLTKGMWECGDMDITFVSKIRNEIRFDSLDDLRKQLEKDREACLTLI